MSILRRARAFRLHRMYARRTVIPQAFHTTGHDFAVMMQCFHTHVLK